MMRLILLTATVMVAFAANSLLNRLAVGSGDIDAYGFALVRLGAGAAVLVLLCRLQRRPLVQPRRDSVIGALALTTYMIGFSLAYQSLDAGLGALVLFGVVQVAMFAWGAVTGAQPALGQLLGALLAFAGLAYVVWPSGAVAVSPFGAACMALAGLGWAAYSLNGRRARDPLVSTAVNFIGASLLVLPGLWWLGDLQAAGVTGLMLAVCAGAVTSGLGYALWYRVLPQLDAAVAATVQLSVPPLAIAAGVIGLGEDLSLRLGLGALAILGGIGLVIAGAAQRQTRPRPLQRRS